MRHGQLNLAAPLAPRTHKSLDVPHSRPGSGNRPKEVLASCNASNNVPSASTSRLPSGGSLLPSRSLSRTIYVTKEKNPLINKRNAGYSLIVDAELRRQAQILVALDAAPLDRIHLMKTIFLYWHRSGRPSDGPFEFKPYLYGPCAFDLYRALDFLVFHRFAIQLPHQPEKAVPYYITALGRKAMRRIALPEDERETIKKIARNVAGLDLKALLTAVYREAPDFASKSLLRELRPAAA